jgi:ribosomal protein S18 acetylase RimI-like enzyme
MPIKIRKLQKTDCKDVAKLANEFSDFLNTLKPTESKKITAKTFLQFGFGREKSFNGLVAEYDEKLIGYALYSYGFDTQLGARYIVLEDLFVNGSVRGQNIGGALCEKLISIANKNKCSDIRASVWKLNPRAKNFYQKLNFTDYSKTHNEEYMILEI